MKFNTKNFSLGKFMMTLASICFCLVLISTSMMSGLYAKYVARDTADDSGRTIKFYELDITETGDFKSLTDGSNQFVFIPGVPLEKNVEISFGGSEAATIVFVSIEAENWTVSNKYNFVDSNGQLSWSVADGWEHYQSDGNTHVYYKTVAPNNSLNNVKFIKNDTINVSSSGNIEMYTNYPNTQFTVKGYAVQANGFKTVGDAWTSLNS